LKGISQFNDVDVNIQPNFNDYFGNTEVTFTDDFPVLKTDGVFTEDDVNHIVDPIEFVKNFNVNFYFFKTFRNKRRIMK
jgi:hypothetical protein